jgi:hypothetical protein
LVEAAPLATVEVPTMTTVKLTQVTSTSKRARAHELLDELLDVVFDAGPGEYTTHDSASWPPHSRNRRHARDRIKRAGGDRIGFGRATQWRIARADYDAFYVRRAFEEVAPQSAHQHDDVKAAADALVSWRQTGGR